MLSPSHSFFSFFFSLYFNNLLSRRFFLTVPNVDHRDNYREVFGTQDRNANYGYLGLESSIRACSQSACCQSTGARRGELDAQYESPGSYQHLHEPRTQSCPRNDQGNWSPFSRSQICILWFRYYSQTSFTTPAPFIDTAHASSSIEGCDCMWSPIYVPNGRTRPAEPR